MPDITPVGRRFAQLNDVKSPHGKTRFRSPYQESMTYIIFFKSVINAKHHTSPRTFACSTQTSFTASLPPARSKHKSHPDPG